MSPHNMLQLAQENSRGTALLINNKLDAMCRGWSRPRPDRCTPNHEPGYPL